MTEITKNLQRQEDKIDVILIPMTFVHTDTKKMRLYHFSFGVRGFICYN